MHRYYADLSEDEQVLFFHNMADQHVLFAEKFDATEEEKKAAESLPSAQSESQETQFSSGSQGSTSDADEEGESQPPQKKTKLCFVSRKGGRIRTQMSPVPVKKKTREEYVNEAEASCAAYLEACSGLNLVDLYPKELGKIVARSTDGVVIVDAMKHLVHVDMGAGLDHLEKKGRELSGADDTALPGQKFGYCIKMARIILGAWVSNGDVPTPRKYTMHDN